ncbi:hypothetical protein MNB_SUP05-5-59 [hydrothermal vent metagenome]|uniref:Uncharacterized protein n=1 Tax=hydrothermal vent metagenome TaxID=652676 RepID=A0A1W1C9Y8_9ZZZZ
MLKIITLISFLSLFISSCNYHLKENVNLVNAVVIATEKNEFVELLEKSFNKQTTAKIKLIIGAESLKETAVVYDNNGGASEVKLTLTIPTKITNLKGDKIYFDDSLSVSNIVAIPSNVQSKAIIKQQTYQNLRNNLLETLSLKLQNIH